MAQTLADIFNEEETAQKAEPLPATALIAEVEKPVQTVGALEAFGRGVRAGATAEFDEEAGAALQTGLEAMRRKLEKTNAGKRALEALGFGVTPTQTMVGGKAYKPELEALGDVYTQAREEGRAEKALAASQQPAAYTGGQITGAIAQQLAVPVPATLGGAVGMGALTGLGASETDLTKGELGQAAQDVAIGAALGAGGYGVAKALPVVAKGVGKAAEKVGLTQATKRAADKVQQALREFAAMRAVKATGAIQSDINKETAKQILRKGETLLAEDLIPFSGSKEVIGQRVMAAQTKAAEAMDDILLSADEAVKATGQGFDWGQVLFRINKEVREKLGATGQRVSGASLRSGEGTFAASIFDDIAQEGAAGGGFAAANRLKSEIADGAFAGVANRLQQKVAKRIVGIFNDEIESQLKTVGGKKALEEFVKAKNVYGATKTAQTGLRRAAAQQGNNLFGLSEMLAGPATAGITAVTGAAPIGIATAGALGALGTKLAKERGSAMLARGTMAGLEAAQRATPVMRQATAKVAQAAQSNPALLGRFAGIIQEAAQRGEKDLAVADYTLANQSEEYRTLRNKLTEMDETE
jgi:hypothetical protein